MNVGLKRCSERPMSARPSSARAAGGGVKPAAAAAPAPNANVSLKDVLDSARKSFETDIVMAATKRPAAQPLLGAAADGGGGDPTAPSLAEAATAAAGPLSPKRAKLDRSTSRSPNDSNSENEPNAATSPRRRRSPVRPQAERKSVPVATSAAVNSNRLSPLKDSSVTNNSTGSSGCGCGGGGGGGGGGAGAADRPIAAAIGGCGAAVVAAVAANLAATFNCPPKSLSVSDTSTISSSESNTPPSVSESPKPKVKKVKTSHVSPLTAVKAANQNSPVKSLLNSKKPSRNKNHLLKELTSLGQDEGVSKFQLHSLPSTRRKNPSQDLLAVRRVSVDQPKAKLPYPPQERKVKDAAGAFGVGASPPRVPATAPPLHAQKPPADEQLMSPSALSVLKLLSKDEYTRLWNNQRRYAFKTEPPSPPAGPAEAVAAAAAAGKSSPSSASGKSTPTSVSGKISAAAMPSKIGSVFVAGNPPAASILVGKRPLASSVKASPAAAVQSAKKPSPASSASAAPTPATKKKRNATAKSPTVKKKATTAAASAKASESSAVKKKQSSVAGKTSAAAAATAPKKSKLGKNVAAAQPKEAVGRKSANSSGGKMVKRSSSPVPQGTSGKPVTHQNPRANAIPLAKKPTKTVPIPPKVYQDIVIRMYPRFAQILLSPTTTVMKQTMNAKVCDELIEALKEFDADDACRAVLITGIGQVFCHGVDLMQLNHSSVINQRKAADLMANGLKRLITFMLDYPKLLVAGVNGEANGLGVTILPLFDIVFASDKAIFCTSAYGRLGQIPEAFASQSLLASHGGLAEMLLLGRTITASQAQSYGLVGTVVWPDKFLEEIVPRLQSAIDASSQSGGGGVAAAKANLKRNLKQRVLAVAERETEELIECWTQPNFGKNVKQYMKSNHVSYQPIN